MSFNKCYTCVTRILLKIQNVTQENFLVLLCPSLHFSSQLVLKPLFWFFSPEISFTCSTISYKWNQSVCTLVWNFSDSVWYHGIYSGGWVYTFLLLSSIPLYDCISLFTHSSADGHLDCFWVLAIKNKGGTSILLWVLPWTYAFICLEYILRVGSP